MLHSLWMHHPTAKNFSSLMLKLQDIKYNLQQHTPWEVKWKSWRRKAAGGKVFCFSEGLIS